MRSAVVASAAAMFFAAAEKTGEFEESSQTYEGKHNAGAGRVYSAKKARN